MVILKKVSSSWITCSGASCGLPPAAGIAYGRGVAVEERRVGDERRSTTRKLAMWLSKRPIVR